MKISNFDRNGQAVWIGLYEAILYTAVSYKLLFNYGYQTWRVFIDNFQTKQSSVLWNLPRSWENTRFQVIHIIFKSLEKSWKNRVGSFIVNQPY